MSQYVTSDFDYDLPPALIAQYPLPNRTGSRLLALDIQQQQLADHAFEHIVDLLQPGDFLVLNDTRVIPARLYGYKQKTGGAVEIMLERMLDSHQALAQIKASKSPAIGTRICLHARDDERVRPDPASTDSPWHLTVGERVGEFYKLDFVAAILPTLADLGHQPLPPYIDRPAEDGDDERYQTVFAKNHGAVAAPTAGLHFDQALLDRIKSKGVQLGYVTLHVGAGTFQPVRCDHIAEHKIHAEYVVVSDALCHQVTQTKAAGGRVVAVGTTVVRSLEAAAGRARGLGDPSSSDMPESNTVDDFVIAPMAADTRLFIYPGYRFACVDAMLTNFHLPRSSLLMLVSAFAGFDLTRTAYQHAIAKQYRFFSYGDAMWLANK